jgi:hypothetical protein
VLAAPSLDRIWEPEKAANLILAPSELDLDVVLGYHGHSRVFVRSLLLLLLFHVERVILDSRRQGEADGRPASCAPAQALK